jgi:hypothetical protein
MIVHTGLKHSIFNKLRLRGQGELYDRKPCIMIVPILTLDAVKNWDGAGYDALVVAGPHLRTTIGVVCSGMGMLERGKTAEFEDISVARNMLDQVVRGLAHSLMRQDRDIPNEQINAWEELRRPFQAPDVLGVKVPIPVTTNQIIRVRQVTFGGDGGHPAPDPLLLSIKAAINWSWRHHQKLLPAGELSDDDEASERSVLAEEQYLEWQQELLRPKNRQDLAQGLGQPNGYQNVAKAN